MANYIMTAEPDNQAGKTNMIDHLIYQSVEDRDGMLNTGMRDGAGESLDRLEQLIVTMIIS